MADRVPLSDRQKAAQLTRERQQAQTLIAEYRRIWERIKTDAMALQAQIAATQAAGQTISITALRQDERLQALLRQLQAEIALTQAVLEQTITQAQADAVLAGQADAVDLIRAQLPPNFQWTPVLPSGAIEQLVGYAQDGRPLGQLLAELGPLASQEVLQETVNALALGQNPRQLARQIRNALGGNMARALTIARTETLRAYRESSRGVYQANPQVVTEWVWYAKLDLRTCAMCWALSGEVFDTDEMMETHPSCRCALIPRTKTWEELGFPGLKKTRVEVPRGPDVFARLSEAEQRTILGPAKYAAYESGDITLADLVQKTHSRRWGAGRREASLATALGR